MTVILFVKVQKSGGVARPACCILFNVKSVQIGSNPSGIERCKAPGKGRGEKRSREKLLTCISGGG
jgi:hypothetical protein